MSSSADLEALAVAVGVLTPHTHRKATPVTDLELQVHPIVEHMGTHQKTALMKLARGERVGRQTIGSFESKGLIRRDENGHITITEEGSTALHLINQEGKP